MPEGDATIIQSYEVQVLFGGFVSAGCAFVRVNERQFAVALSPVQANPVGWLQTSPRAPARVLRLLFPLAARENT